MRDLASKIWLHCYTKPELKKQSVAIVKKSIDLTVNENANINKTPKFDSATLILNTLKGKKLSHSKIVKDYDVSTAAAPSPPHDNCAFEPVSPSVSHSESSVLLTCKPCNGITTCPSVPEQHGQMPSNPVDRSSPCTLSKDPSRKQPIRSMVKSRSKNVPKDALKPLICPVCSTSCKSGNGFLAHIRKMHPKLPVNSFNKMAGMSSMCKCVSCDGFYTNNNSLYQHMKSKKCSSQPSEIVFPVGSDVMLEDNSSALGVIENFVKNTTLEELIASFSWGLTRIHHTWKRPLGDLVNRMLANIDDCDCVVVEEDIHTAGMLILPGLIRWIQRKKQDKVITMLTIWLTATYPAHAVLAYAIMQHPSRVGGLRPMSDLCRKLSDRALTNSVNNLFGQSRLSTIVILPAQGNVLDSRNNGSQLLIAMSVIQQYPLWVLQVQIIASSKVSTNS